ncbi:energy transducer TonB [Magnetospirillum sp. SS-4]|uniref:cell division protein FtsL n=1 Tax=Magnetospirillum sp. SS-4 TaxID=2681465 RepID=UPI001381F6A3|nr:energy transducer TonB [Magnetospirillum sp. SS-4]CAA7622972.1 Periplasmic protein TonB [Magnetospirillum sp. SS-4]
MNRGILGTILWTCLIGCIGIGLFVVKHEVKDQERRLATLSDEIHRNQETIHILRAEWSYLNDPARLRALSEKHLGMRPVTLNQVATLDQVLKDGLPPPVMLAAATPARPPQPGSAVKPSPPLQPVKLVEGGAPRPRPADQAKPPPKPPQPKPGTVTLAESPPPPAPAATPVPARAAGRAIIIRSPALAEREEGAP